MRPRRQQASFFFLVLLTGLLLFVPAAAQAQTGVVVQPTLLTFTASPDHNAVIAGTTTPVLTRYDVSVLSGTTVVLVPTSVDKPTPDGTNTITVALTTIAGLLGLPKNVLYTVRVVAVGPAGTSAFAVSNPFVFPLVPAPPGGVVVKP